MKGSTKRKSCPLSRMTRSALPMKRLRPGSGRPKNSSNWCRRVQEKSRSSRPAPLGGKRQPRADGKAVSELVKKKLSTPS